MEIGAWSESSVIDLQSSGASETSTTCQEGSRVLTFGAPVLGTQMLQSVHALLA